MAPVAQKMLTPAEMREDLRIARGALEESHVGLYWFTSKQELDRRFQRLSLDLDRPMTARAFHRRLLPVVASLRHGHTTLTLPVQGAGYRLRQLSKNGKYLPFEVRVLNNRLYVVTDMSEGAQVGPGAEIIRIDGRPARALLDQMRLNVSADGANDTFKLFQLGPGYQFHYLLDLLFGPAKTYDLEIIPLSGKSKIRRLVSAESPERMAGRFRERTGRDLDTFPSALQFKMLDDGVALLTVYSFY
jgi:hypothetical protein